jgi:hypothetical protein
MRDDGLDVHVDYILRLFRAYEAITASTEIRTAWRKARFEYENRNRTTYLRVNERQVHESPDFRDVWSFDYQES